MKRLAIPVFAAVMMTLCAFSLAPRQARAGGSVDAIAVRVTGSPLSSITSSPIPLSPNFTQSIIDYVWRCHSGINNIQLTLAGAFGQTITAGGRNALSVTLDETLVENQALIVTAPDPSGAGAP